jgi:cysteine desulfurase
MSSYYFDYSSSCPPFPEALEEFMQISEEFFGNPSSIHFLGQRASKVLDKIKQKFGQLCGLRNARIILTSGGTEANNLVIRGIMERFPKGRLLLASDVHSSSWFAKELYGNRVDVLPLENEGQLSLNRIMNSIKKNTVLLSVVHVCNETGILHNINAYGDLCRKNNILFHCDGVQALGHIKMDLENTPVDFYTFSSHKFGGPRGVGGIFTDSYDIYPQIRGGDQEKRFRAGTENVAGLAGALKALEKSNAILPEESLRLRRLTKQFLIKLSAQVPDFLINSNKEKGLPGLMSVTFPKTLATNIVTEMSLRGFALSTGSACHSQNFKPSRIIMALGRSAEEALGTVRISMGRNTTEEEVQKLIPILGEVVNRQRMLA